MRLYYSVLEVRHFQRRFLAGAFEFVVLEITVPAEGQGHNALKLTSSLGSVQRSLRSTAWSDAGPRKPLLRRRLSHMNRLRARTKCLCTVQRVSYDKSIDTLKRHLEEEEDRREPGLNWFQG